MMRQIVDACAGNPLYARELVVGAIEDGSMRCERGLWRMEGRPAVTPSVKALIKRRIGALEPEVLRPLELLALGEPLRLGELVALTSFERSRAARSGACSRLPARPMTQTCGSGIRSTAM